MVAVVASKLDVMIRRELDVPLLKSTFWTDSRITPAYIQSDSIRFTVFVANRVSLIRENTKPYQWCHIIDKENRHTYCPGVAMPARFLLFGPTTLSLCRSTRICGQSRHLTCRTC